MRPPLYLLCALLSAFALAPAVAQAQALDPQQVAQIRHAQQEALERIDKEHGERLPGQMTNVERREVIRKQQEAQVKVLQEHGVSTRDFVHYTTRMSPEAQRQAGAVQQRLREEAKAKQKAKEQAKKSAQKDPTLVEVELQLGFSEEEPVTLERNPDALPEVEEGIPVD